MKYEFMATLASIAGSTFMLRGHAASACRMSELTLCLKTHVDGNVLLEGTSVVAFVDHYMLWH